MLTSYLIIYNGNELYVDAKKISYIDNRHVIIVHNNNYKNNNLNFIYLCFYKLKNKNKNPRLDVTTACNNVIPKYAYCLLANLLTFTFIYAKTQRALLKKLNKKPDAMPHMDKLYVL